MKERLLLFLSLLLTSPFLSAQMSWSYSGSSKINFISNFPDCTTGGVNCCHASKLYAAKIFSTNGHTYAIDANGNGYSYNEYPTNTWTAHPEWGVVYGLQ